MPKYIERLSAAGLGLIADLEWKRKGNIETFTYTVRVAAQSKQREALDDVLEEQEHQQMLQAIRDRETERRRRYDELALDEPEPGETFR